MGVLTNNITELTLTLRTQDCLEIVEVCGYGAFLAKWGA